MQKTSFLKHAVALLAIGSFAAAPFSALALDHDHDHGKGKEDHGRRDRDDGDHWRGGNWNPAPPKKNGRHDNRNWNKGRDDDDWRYQRRIPAPSNDYRYRSPSYNYNRYPATSNGRYPSNYGYPSTYDRRQQTKNEWRNLAIGAGLVGVLGLLSHDSRLTFAGAAGALYSAYRYEQDRKSQNSLDRARAYYFSQPYFVRNGQRFDRRTVVKNGQRYYQFVRG